MRLHIAGIDLVSEGNKPYNIASKRLLVYPFIVEGPKGVSRDDLNKLKGHNLHGKPIKGVESYTIENQYKKTIGIAVDA